MGYLCNTEGRSTAPTITEACSANKFCPDSSREEMTCPPGTFTASTGGINEDSCTACPAGSACKLKITALEPCAAGYYCPTRTIDPMENPCPENTYTSSTSLTEKSLCSPCNTGGKYCPEGSPSEKDCEKGYKCPGTQLGKTACPGGTHSPGGQADCSSCPQGSICPEGYHEINPILCPKGYYMDDTSSQGPCKLCPEGKKCSTQGVVTPVSCNDGEWSIQGSDSCTTCPEGYYCASGVKNECPAGSYCPSPYTAPTDCDPGYYCPGKTAAQLACPPGTYSAAKASTCTASDAGHYSHSSTSKTTMDANQCAAGFYCEAGAKGSIDKPCPPGYYVDAGFNIESTCQKCTAGYYCIEGSDTTTRKICPTGHYCPEGSAVPTKCPRSTFNNVTGSDELSDCIACPAGKVCTQDGLTTPDYECDDGYYCIQGAYNSQPHDGIIGGLCGEGTYCPRGAAQPTTCPSGTFNVFKGCRSSAECLSCPFGFICDDNDGTNQLCPAGYYCPGGTSTATRQQPEAGYHTIAGQGDQIPCLVGTYSTSAGQSTCTTCQAGEYCSTKAATSANTCPVGKYCPADTVTPKLCPHGTFRAGTGATSLADCTLCTQGNYCEGIGKIAITDVCEAGFYCNEGAFHSKPAYASDVPGARFGPCPPGQYCPEGTVIPTKCGVGKYSPSYCNTQASDCYSCLPGEYCPNEVMAMPAGNCTVGYYCPLGCTTPTANDCPKGHYCPAGSAFSYKCPAGTYQDQMNQGSCLECPQGKYCVFESQTDGVDCPEGYYCPAGTGDYKIYPCPPGTYNNQLGRYDISQCTPCDPGHYCTLYAQTAPAGQCEAGYYCIEGSTSPTPIDETQGGKCTAGEICTAGSSSPNICPATKICNAEIMDSVTTICKDGFKCGTGLNYSVPAGISATSDYCDHGKWCQSGVATNCGVSTYLPSKGAGTVGATECLTCSYGHYCETEGLYEPTAKCPDGYYCLTGQSVGTDHPCSVGYMCPLGSFEEAPCPPGQYQDETAKATCKDCPAGSYCMYSSTSGTDTTTACPIGLKCPDTGMDHPTICTAGTYQDTPGQTTCKSCTEGKYCDRAAMTAQSTCPEGYYCPAGEINGKANICEPGYYCPAGSSTQTACPAGKYCADYGLATPSGDCSPGYYCTTKATVPNPTDGTTGNICPEGHYCPDGNTIVECSAGKFNQYRGSESVADCIDCLVGMICTTSGLAYPTTSCPSGKQCFADGTQQDCPAGYMCPSGITDPILCLPGTYQDDPGQGTCKDCPAGKYCGFVGTTTAPVDCPAGYYCPAKSPNYEPFPCPAGYFNSQTGKSSINDCTKCTTNYFCLTSGLSAVTGACSSGYLCPEGSIIPNSLSNLCPKNNYCIGGIAIACPARTYTYGDVLGATNSNNCMNCIHGKLCPNHDTGIMDCPAGSYCVNGLQSSCPAGSYCPTGSFVGLKCHIGTYTSSTGKSTCSTCPEGTDCPALGTITPTTCPANFICRYSSLRPIVCDYGKYASSNICVDCPPGKWCWKSATNSIKGDCQDGYICSGGSDSPTPFYPGVVTSTSSNRQSYNGKAAKGCYTKSTVQGGTGVNTLCPVGTYMPSVGASECIPCPPGHYCDQIGITDVSEKICEGGYYCKGGATTSRPTDGVTGDACPASRYCPEGTNRWLSCPDGYTTLSTASSECRKCPEGYSCTSANPFMRCASGNTACTEGTGIEPLCPPGTYRDGSSCSPCPPGLFCVDGRSVSAPGDCSHGQCCTAGFLCTGGASSPKPGGIGGTACEAGYYCSEGATTTGRCPKDSYIFTIGARQVSDCTGCMEGYICTSGNPLPTPCAKGNYCPTGTTGMTPCPQGSYSLTEKNAIVHLCLSCPAGYHCSEEDGSGGIVNYENYPCPEGKYCFEHTVNPINCPIGTYSNQTGGQTLDVCVPCPPGYYCDKEGTSNITENTCKGGEYCPGGTAYPLVCPEGYYCNNVTAYDKAKCPANHYCPPGTEKPLSCNTGESCPEGSGYPLKCMPGWYSDYVNGILRCQQCPPGTYSMSGISTECKICEAGYVCLGGTTAQYPWNIVIHRGYKCPKGAYCPAGSSNPILCPAGTYNPDEGSTSSVSCILCKPSTFGSLPGQEACLPCGDSATSEQGWTSCACKGKNRAFFPSDSSCRCKPGYEYLEGGVIQSDVNSKVDCQPIVYRRCEGDEVRSHDGTCKGLDDCESACNGAPGVRSLTLGICECSHVEQVEKVCNKDCRRAMPKVTITSDGKISVVPVNGETEQATLTPRDLPRFSSTHLKCPEGKQCEAKSIRFENGGRITGSYGMGKRLANQYVGAVTKTKRLLADYEKERLLQSVGSAEIANPVMCIKEGDSVIFEVDGNGHYPVYQKDSLLNSNPNFDYGAFKMLSEQVTAQLANGENIEQFFGYTFTDAGRYYFTDSIDFEKTLIVYVTKDSETCATEDAYLQPRTTAALSVFGLALNEGIMLQPDYVMLAVILCTFLGTLGMLLFLMKWVSEHMWKAQKAPQPKFRSLNKKFDISDTKLFANTARAPLTSQRDSSFLGHDMYDESFIADGLEGINTQKLEELDPFIIDKILKNYQAYKKYLKKELLKVCEDQAKRIEELSDAIEQIRFLLNERYEKLIGLLKLDVDYTKLKNVKIKTAEDKDESKKREKRVKPSEIRLKKSEEKKANEILRKIVEEKSEISLMEDSRKVAGETKKKPAEPIEEKIKKDFEERLKLMSSLTEFEKAKLKDELSTELINLEYLLAGERENQEIAIRRLLQMKRKKPVDNRKATDLIDLEHLSPEEQKVKETIEKELEDETRQRTNDIQQLALRKIEKAKLKLLAQLGAPANLTEKEKSIMLENHSDELKKMLEEIKSEKEKQLDDLNKRLEKRKQAKVAEKVLAMREEMEPEASGQETEDSNIEIPPELTQNQNANKLKQEEQEKLSQLEQKHREQYTRIEEAHNAEMENKEADIEEDLELEVEKEIDMRKAKTEERYRHKQLGIEEARRKLRDQLLFLSGDKEASQKLAEEIKVKDEKIQKLLEDEKKEQEYLLEEKINKRKIAKQKKLLAFKSAQKDARVELKLRQLKEKQLVHGQYQLENIKQVLKNLLDKERGLEGTQQKAFKIFEQLWNEKEAEELSQMFGRHLAEKENKLREVYHKNVEQRLMEKKGVKDKYKLLYDDLEEEREKMDPETYEARQKELRVEEENDLKEMDIKETMALRKEEFALRQELEERAANELNELQEKLAREKVTLMRELFGQLKEEDTALVNKMKDLREAIDRDKDRRIKELELDKKILLEQCENDLKVRYNSFEDVIRKQRETEKLLKEKKGNIERMLEERKKQMAELKDKAQFTPEQEKLLLQKYHQELKTLETAMETERNRQFALMREKLESKQSKREREKSYHKKKIAFMMGTVNKNVTLAQSLTEKVLAMAKAPQNELERSIQMWKKDIEERDKTQKTTTFETLQKFLDNVSKYKEKGLDGIYLQGEQYHKYLKLMKTSKNLQRKLEELHKVKASGALLDLKAALKVFAEDDYDKIKAKPQRIGGGFRCYDEDGNIVWDLFKFVHSKQ
eukprot:TRINITY_DN2541_c0_g1_i1.p1 TRINITY_DN2541_c0_g1~~TRINITY_DN2541_c0_g1_i1.p1  ORF type:complete len:3538 (+),score=416.51 TRINITY_DN2541_c0_g1_i1:4982-15595(+)